MNEKSKLYATQHWKTRTAPWLKRNNPVCQAVLEDGRQCKSASKVAHHLRDPRDYPALAFEPSNIVCVCVAHHPGGLRGERPECPSRFVATVGHGNVLHDHGWGAPEWRPEWNGKPRSVWASKQEKSGTGLLPCGGVTTSDEAALDAALAREDEP